MSGRLEYLYVRQETWLLQTCLLARQERSSEVSRGVAQRSAHSAVQCSAAQQGEQNDMERITA
eukprot:2935621-Alexandrium_andersonii.AAC.1